MPDTEDVLDGKEYLSMHAALLADGEKLQAMTGQNHGPVFWADPVYFPQQLLGFAAYIRSGFDPSPATREMVAKQFEAAAEELSSVRAALKPFAAVAEHDIGESADDTDKFAPFSSSYNRAEKLTVGDLRRALAVVGKST